MGRPRLGSDERRVPTMSESAVPLRVPSLFVSRHSQSGE